ncbi:HNH endonuclease family protein [Pseudarthrobacter sp. J75]|uniref:HNH endonuclease family protein n=1 Tax=unclassified Pseudarthrobacter TaxID=2647000 RepID=UPI002E81BC4F|nr:MULTISPECIES: HNH endonuclease family protein [unclassified Pseudarthrobacter]MEE2522927.1 HNH endonuclease family protein [Pseudarthrobacter sp. J47]MEE2529479.1 HNH endonuclease family protein [Pseudarthrobacter sp. J75]
MSRSWQAYRRARRRSRQAWLVLVVMALGTVLGLGWFFSNGQFALAEPTVAGPTDVPVFNAAWMKPVTSVHAVPDAKAADAVELLAVKGRAPKGDYSREQFGQAWFDVDRNGCDTRNDILRRDLTDVTFTRNSQCGVAAGTLVDPYTAKVVAFQRGSQTSREVQIDHVVALSDAWQKGAQELTPAQRQALANDPLNLIAADGDANQQKGAGDTATWLPKNKSIRCHYVARQVSVKIAYGLWITQAEKDAMKRVLGACPEQRSVAAG